MAQKKQKTIAEQIMNQPPSKIYFLRNNDGKFYNSSDGVWYSEKVNAIYDKNYSKMLEVLKMDKFSDCGIYETTDHILWQEIATWTTNIVLVGSYFSELLLKVSNRMPTISQVNKLMYQKCSLAVEVLRPVSNWNDDFVEHKEDATDEVSGHMKEYFHELSQIDIHEMAEVTEILKMYRVDRASMMGIATTIRKRNPKSKEIQKSY